MASRTLTPEQVREAREWYARLKATPSFKAMAGKLGIDPSNLRKVVQRQTYKEVS